MIKDILDIARTRVSVFAEVWRGQFFYWSSQTCTRVRGLFVRLSPCSKTWKLPYFRPFQPDTQILSALTALYWPSTAFYWPSTTKYQPVPPYTDPVPPNIAPYWPSTIVYQPVPLNTDPVLPSVNQYQLMLLLPGGYRLLHSLPHLLINCVPWQC